MENSKINIILSFLSLIFSVISFFVMYYIFAGLALILGIVTLKDKQTRGLSICSIAIVCITFIFKMINIIVTNGNLPEWLINGLF